MSTPTFNATRLAVILVGGAALFIAVGAYVVSKQPLPPTYVGALPSSATTTAPIDATREHVARADAGQGTR